MSIFVIGNITTLPREPIWDETYYIPAVEKYKNGTFFMESHPPLGKLIITAGELLVNPNQEYSKLNPVAKLCLANTIIEVDGIQVNLAEYRKSNPNAIDNSKYNSSNNINETNKLDKGYSFCGVRFMPTLFAIFIPLLLYLIVELLIRNRYVSFFIASLALFDNALLTHYRAGMIDGIQMVFILASFYFLIKFLQSKKYEFGYNWFLMLLFIAFAIATKHNGIFLLTLPFLIMANKINLKSILKLILSFGIIILIYSLVFMVHIDNGRTFVANSQDRLGYYNADEQTKEYLTQSSNDFNQVKILLSNFEYMNNYHMRVPVLDKNNPGENGSYPYSWPLMKKVIIYNNSDNKKLVLFGNPIVWVMSLLTLFAALWTLTIGRIKLESKNIQNYQLLILFSALYICYGMLMYISSNLRVMYLYHYLVDFVISMIILSLVIQLNGWDKRANITIFIFLYILVLIGFGIISPYTYYLKTSPNYFINKLI